MEAAGWDAGSRRSNATQRAPNRHTTPPVADKYGKLESLGNCGLRKRKSAPHEEAFTFSRQILGFPGFYYACGMRKPRQDRQLPATEFNPDLLIASATLFYSFLTSYAVI